jgi:hypothetical protein
MLQPHCVWRTNRAAITAQQKICRAPVYEFNSPRIRLGHLPMPHKRHRRHILQHSLTRTQG